MTIYLDSSSLVKIYIDDPGSQEVRRLVDQADVVATSAIAYPEVRATFARRRREKLLSASMCSVAIRQLDLDWPRFLAVPFSNESASAAGFLADEHGLRALDAIHLAAFETVLAHTDDDTNFSSSDERLVKAAKKLG